VKAFAAALRGLPMPARWAFIAATVAGLTGGIAGLVIGLFTYVPTAPFAAVEVGLPAVFAGGIAGLLAGTIMTAARRVRRRGPSSL
jgi:hypothetical protein